MNLAASLTLISNPELDKLLQTGSDLKPGDKLEGKIIKIRDDGKALVDFGKFQAAVELKEPVNEGDILHAVVVEKGKQLKLRIESIEPADSSSSKTPTPQETPTGETEQIINRLDQEHEKNIADLRMKLDQLFRQQTTDTGTEEKTETISQQVRDPRTTLKIARDFQQARDEVVKQIDELKAIIEKSDAPVSKEAKEIISNLEKASDQIRELKSPEDIPKLREIVEKEVTPQLKELQKVIDKEIAIPDNSKTRFNEELSRQVKDSQQTIEIVIKKLPSTPPGTEPVTKEGDTGSKTITPNESTPQTNETLRTNTGKEVAQIKEALETISQSPDKAPVIQPRTIERVETVLKDVVDIVRNLPDNAAAQQKLESLSQPVRNIRSTVETARDFQQARDEIVKQIDQLKSMVEDSGIPVSKEIKNIISNLEKAAEKIAELKYPRDIQELKEIVQKEVTPRLNQLQQAIEKEVSLPESPKAQFLDELSRRVQDSQQTIETSVKKLPSTAPQDTERAIRELEAVLKTIEKTEVTPKESIPQTNETLRTNTGKEVAQIKEAIETISQSPDKTPVISPQTTERIETALKDVVNLVRNLPDNAATQQKLESLSQPVQTLRSTVETARDFQQARDEIFKQIDQLKTMVEDSGIPVSKEIKLIISNLKKASEQIRELKSTEDIPKLREIVENEVAPRLKQFQQAIEKEVTLPDSPKAQFLDELNRRAQDSQQAVEDAVRKLPSTPPQDTERVIKELETALKAIFKTPSTPVSSQAPYAEDIKDIYENIKQALQILQSRMQRSGQEIGLPEDIKQIFNSVQTDLKLAEMSDTILKQLNSLKPLIDQADLSFEKIIKQIHEMLSDMTDRINEFKSTQQFQEMGNYLKTAFTSQMKQIEMVFSDPRWISEARNPQKFAEIIQTIQSLQSNVESALETGTEGLPGQDQNQVQGFNQKIADLANGLSNASNRFSTDPATRESIANLAKNIEALLERLPQGISDTSSETALPAKIRSLLSTLQSSMEPIDINDSTFKLVPRLKSLVEDSGIFFEKKISDIITKLSDASGRLQGIRDINQLPEIRSIIEKDLKPNLLQLKEFLNNEQNTASLPGDSKTIETIRNTVESLLNNIDMQQTRAVENQAKQEPVQFFSFQLPIKDEETAELKVFYNRGRKKESPDEFKLSLLLDMNKLGEVRSDFLYIKKDLSISFYVKNQEIKDFFDGHLEEVNEILGREFEDLKMSVVVSKEQIAGLEKEEAEAEIISEKAVNVKV